MDSGILTIKFTIICATYIILRLHLILLVYQLLDHMALQGSSIPILVLPCSQSIQGQITWGEKQICCLCSVEYVGYASLSCLWTLHCDIGCGKVEFPKDSGQVCKR